MGAGMEAGAGKAGGAAYPAGAGDAGNPGAECA